MCKNTYIIVESQTLITMISNKKIKSEDEIKFFLYIYIYIYISEIKFFLLYIYAIINFMVELFH